MANFTHLNDTRFPNVDNIDVYSYHNEFDYTRWVPNTKIKLCNVRWNSDYRDCVKFANDSERDKWFDSLAESDANVQYLKTNIRINTNQVKIPMPFDIGCEYNYLVVDVPVATSESAMLNYERNDGIRRWHFFITDWIETAPSNCTLAIQLDYWTQYINSVGFNYMMLERGHAPMSKTDTDSYLANPMGNCEYLLADDVNFGGETVCDGGKFIPFGNGEKYLCLASTCEPEQIKNIGTVGTSGASFTDPTFRDATNYPDSSNRWGYQFEVDGYDFGNGRDYSNVKTPAGNTIGNAADNRVPTACAVYCLPCSKAKLFLDNCVLTNPSFLKTIVGCFMVDKNMLTIGDAYTVSGMSINVCHANANAVTTDIKLTKSMFNFDSKYEKFTKLYTFPYSELEITDNDGKTVSVRVESCGDNVKANALASIAFPYLNMRMFLTGIGGKGSNSYKWQNITSESALEMTNSDWFKFCFDMKIPVYALYMDGNTAWNLNNYNRQMKSVRQTALNQYHASVRGANNAQANATALADTALLNAQNSADAQKSMTDNTADTNNTNTHNQANTVDSNNANNRACASAITSYNNATSLANNTLDDTLATHETDKTNSSMSYATAQANALTSTTTKEENLVTTTSASNNQQATEASVAMSAFGAVALAVGTAGLGSAAAVGTVTSGYGSLKSAEAQVANAQAATNASSAIAAATIAANNANSNNTRSNNTDLLSNTLSHNQSVTENNCDNATNNTNASNNCNKSNTDNTTSTMRTNGDNTASMLKTNASTLQSTQRTNAANTQITSNTNTNYTDKAAVITAQDVLRNAQNNVRYADADSYNEAPIKLTESSDDLAADYYRTRGVQIKVRKQNRYAIARTADAFARYGYAYDGLWNIESENLCLMKHFTYWKTLDCWVYDKGNVNDSAQKAISSIFNQGVTVWSKPDEIGKVNPYDN